MSLSESIKNIELQLEEQVKAEKEQEIITAFPMSESEGIEIAMYIEKLRKRNFEIMDAYGG